MQMCNTLDHCQNLMALLEKRDKYGKMSIRNAVSVKECVI